METLRSASVGLGWWGGPLAEKARDAGLELVSCLEGARGEHAIDQLDTVRGKFEQFVADVRKRTKPETGGEEALEATVVLEGIVESARTTGTVVDLDQVRSRE